MHKGYLSTCVIIPEWSLYPLEKILEPTIPQLSPVHALPQPSGQQWRWNQELRPRGPVLVTMLQDSGRPMWVSTCESRA
jgi:hypothetical protein